MKLRQWIFVALAALAGRLKRGRGAPSQDPDPELRHSSQGRIVPAGPPDRTAENLVLACLALSVIAAIGFIVVYAVYRPGNMPNSLLGICLGVAAMSIGWALTIVAKRLVVTEELEEDYPTIEPEAEAEVSQIVHESGSRITRKRMLLGAGAAAGGALAGAALTPVLSLGPIWNTAALEETPWRHGRRIVDEQGKPIAADEVVQGSFYSGFAEGAHPDDIASYLIIVRLSPSKIHLPPGRSGWTPRGILAYSKICTHAGCAIELYRKPTFPVVEPEPAFVCPCHYSTFNPADGAQVIYGPAGRPLPQLPLMIDSQGNLRAAGNFSTRVGPSWWGVRFRPTTE
jgi:ubiquinol-cytochrome c reductase iron-sulfur subunit